MITLEAHPPSTFDYFAVAENAEGAVDLQLLYIQTEAGEYRHFKPSPETPASMETPLSFIRSKSAKAFGIVLVERETGELRVFWVPERTLDQAVESRHLVMPDFYECEPFQREQLGCPRMKLKHPHHISLRVQGLANPRGIGFVPIGDFGSALRILKSYWPLNTMYGYREEEINRENPSALENKWYFYIQSDVQRVGLVLVDMATAESRVHWISPGAWSKAAEEGIIDVPPLDQCQVFDWTVVTK